MISLIYIFVKYIVVYKKKKKNKHTKAIREKIMIEKQKKISELVSLQTMEKDMDRQKKEPYNKELIEVLTPKLWIL